MIDPRRAQRSFGDKLIAEEVKDLHEDWMIHADEVLADEEILAVVYEALAKRRRLSRTRGRKATPAEVVLRLLVLKHIRSWSYATLEREVRTNLLYRNFTRLGFALQCRDHSSSRLLRFPAGHDPRRHARIYPAADAGFRRWKPDGVLSEADCCVDPMFWCDFHAQASRHVDVVCTHDPGAEINLRRA